MRDASSEETKNQSIHSGRSELPLREERKLMHDRATTSPTTTLKHSQDGPDESPVCCENLLTVFARSRSVWRAQQFVLSGIGDLRKITQLGNKALGNSGRSYTRRHRCPDFPKQFLGNCCPSFLHLHPLTVVENDLLKKS
jgi:hypothetical protein